MDKLKDLLQNKEAIAEIRKLVLPILLVALGFGLGYKSVPAPTKRSVCGSDLDKLDAANIKVGNLEGQVTELKKQVSSCQDACTKRVNAEADLQKKKCSEEKAKEEEKQKKNLTAFTCAKCKQRGYCK